MVSRGRLESLPTEIGQLTNLQNLLLIDNRLESLPTEIGQLTNLQTLDLRDNPDLGIPPEILGPEELHRSPNAPAEVLEYYFAARQASRPLHEAKLLIVGQGGVGKTSLVRRLIEDEFNEHEQKTEGINIERWTVAAHPQEGATKPDANIQVNIWDFGGQEIMHATHQFFLTKRSLYVLVLDARGGEHEGRLYYWLKIIQSYGDDSPVLVVINKSDAHKLDLAKNRLTQDYAPNIKGFFPVSCKTSNGLDRLQAAITQHINALPHVHDEVPATYFAVKETLETRAEEENFLDRSEYLDICGQKGLDKPKNQRQLLRFLHDLGTVLHFDDPDAPYDIHQTQILNPKWVTDGVYKIINNNALMKAGGVLRFRDLPGVLNDPTCYPDDRQKFIIGMMHKFELCFSFPGETGKRLLVPELLPVDEPPLLPDGNTEGVLHFQYHYRVLPEGIIPRFIVRSHVNLRPGAAWRRGCVLDLEGNQVVVRGDIEENRIYIAVIGPPTTRRQALFLVRQTFKGIHSTIPAMEVSEFVCASGEPKTLFSYNNLRDSERQGVEEIVGEGQKFRVRDLLDGVSTPEQRAEETKEPERNSPPQPPAPTPSPSPEPAPPLSTHEGREQAATNVWPVMAITLFAALALIVALLVVVLSVDLYKAILVTIAVPVILVIVAFVPLSVLGVIDQKTLLEGVRASLSRTPQLPGGGTPALPGGDKPPQVEDKDQRGSE